MLHYTVEGEGKLVVFLHGFLESSTMWKYLDLSEWNVKKMFIDLPGHGESKGINSNSPSIVYMAQKVNEIISTFSENEIIVIGHSMGGYVAIELAKLNPSIQKVVLLNSNFWADSEDKKRDRNRVVEIIKQAKDKFIHEAIPNLFSYPEQCQDTISEIIHEAKTYTVDGIEFATKAMRDREDNTHWVHQNTSKLIIIQGELDKTAPLAMMKEKLPQDVKLFLIMNAGHMTHIESSNQVLEIFKSLN
jgi:2-succinyl-6-hydroxy-2,4-cyclohexadiene-1-carboxylate synthase